ncbi:MAG: hypothetical protein H6701_02215 [Myxococcales bacterium]|nr:hypothetical protein [Myxococcales bacterium]
MPSPPHAAPLPPAPGCVLTPRSRAHRSPPHPSPPRSSLAPAARPLPAPAPGSTPAIPLQTAPLARPLGHRGGRRLAPRPGLVALALALTLTTPAPAARLPRPTLTRLIDHSALILLTTVEASDPTAALTAPHLTPPPRTRVRLRIDHTFAGAPPASTLTLDLPIGFLPDASLVDIIEAPRFVPGERYLTFYRRGPWHLTPVTAWHHGHHRQTTHDGRAVYVSPTGHCVTHLGPDGFTHGPRVARPIAPPGFPDPGGEPLDALSDAADACLTTDDVHARLASALAAHPLPPTAEVHLTPARHPRDMPLWPDLTRPDPRPPPRTTRPATRHP